jgi:hypothetical protein
MEYADRHWLSSTTKATQLVFYKLFDGQKLHELRMDELNTRGLAGLNEAILETGKQSLCLALKFITIYLEHLQVDDDDGNVQKAEDRSNKKVVIHCVQGKDR